MKLKMKNKNKNTKGIILAGGSGTRLHPLTKITSKQLLPVYDKPMIFYPLNTLIEANIKDIMIITTNEYSDSFKRLIGDGSEQGVSIEYTIQEKPEGIAQALTICESWLEESSVMLILGDNLFFGPNFSKLTIDAIDKNQGATLFCIRSKEPERFGVVNFSNEGEAISIIEKPSEPTSNWVVTGLYIYDNQAVNRSKSLKKSKRGEFEITDLNQQYLNDDNLETIKLSEEYSWLDTGTFDTLLEASNFVKLNKI